MHESSQHKDCERLDHVELTPSVRVAMHESSCLAPGKQWPYLAPGKQWLYLTPGKQWPYLAPGKQWP